MTDRNHHPQQATIDQAYALLEQWTGFAHRSSAPHRLLHTLHHRAHLLGFATTKDYLDALQNHPPTDHEPQRLINLITNGLTAFWRDEPQLSALRQALHIIHSQRSTHDPITIWCAGVSTGEEAYTAAIIADEESLPVHILGTDINTDFLRHAELGIYEPWSLRRLCKERRERYLTPNNDQRYKLDHPAFSSVRFAYHNLLSPPPNAPTPLRAWDLILCQNVLIYLSHPNKEHILNGFAKALSPQGYLILGSSEQIYPKPPHIDAPPFRPVPKAQGFLYRLTTNLHSPPDSELPPPLFTGLEEPTSDICEQDTAQTLLQNAAEHMAAGDIELATDCLEACLSYHPFLPEAHCMMGTTLQALGAHRSALAAFQKALFLEPNHWFAAHRSAAIYELQQQHDLARRAYQRALLAMDHRPDPMQDAPRLCSLLPPLKELRRLCRHQAQRFLNASNPE